MTVADAALLLLFVLPIVVMCGIAFAAWREDVHYEKTYGGNIYMLRIVASSGKEPVKAVSVYYPDAFRFRDILFSLTMDRQIVHIDAHPITRKQRRELRKMGAIE